MEGPGARQRVKMGCEKDWGQGKKGCRHSILRRIKATEFSCILSHASSWLKGIRKAGKTLKIYFSWDTH